METCYLSALRDSALVRCYVEIHRSVKANTHEVEKRTGEWAWDSEEALERLGSGLERS